MISIGIIGAGSFGLFLAEQLSDYAEVKVYSRSGKGGKWAASLEEVAHCDWVLPCIPLEGYRETLKQLKPLLGVETVIIDVCSVKERPVAIIKEALPNQALVATHPLFGPESAKDGLKDHVMVLCPESSDQRAYQKVKVFSEKLQLKVVEMSCQEHDKEMALVHGLTFFVAHALKDMGLQKMKLETPSFKRLRHLAELEEHHSDELFRTIQAGNDYTREVREAFLREANALDQLLET